MDKQLTMRLTGFIASLILTLISFFIILDPHSFHFDIKTAIMVILSLAFIQSLIQLIFFIDVWKGDRPPWNLSVFLSTASIIFVIIFFSIWIMNHLNYNHMNHNMMG